MKKTTVLLCLNLGVLISFSLQANEIENRLKHYQTQGASDFSEKRGESFWLKKYPDPKSPGKKRSCGTCHTDKLKNKGKHARTGKVIDPLAPSSNSERFTDPKFIEKWFKRNCKWVLGRECSPQEKGDVLMYLKDK